jgi:hypothetical protein
MGERWIAATVFRRLVGRRVAAWIDAEILAWRDGEGDDA